MRQGYDYEEHESFQPSSGEDFMFYPSEMLNVFLCSNGRCDPSQQGFGSVLLKALLDNMPLLPAAATGGMYTTFVS